MNVEQFSFKRYMWGRSRKILPAYAIALLFTYFGIPHGNTIPWNMKRNHDVAFEYCPHTFPLSMLLLNNIVGFSGCGLHLWSVSVQMHLFFVYALAVRILCKKPSQCISRVTALAGFTFLLCTIARVAVGHFSHIHMPVPPFDHPDLSTKHVMNAVKYYHTMYFQTPMRLCNFTAGILVAALVRSTQVGKKSIGVFLATGLLSYMYFNVITSIEYDQDPFQAWKYSPAWASLVFHGSPGASLLFSLVLYSLILAGKHLTWVTGFKVYHMLHYLSEVRKI